RMLGLDLTVFLLLLPGSFKRRHLHFGQDEALLRRLRLQGFQAFLECLQIVAHPDATNAAGRDEYAAPLEFVGYPHLTISRLLNREREDGSSRLPDRLGSWPVASCG